MKGNRIKSRLLESHLAGCSLSKVNSVQPSPSDAYNRLMGEKQCLGLRVVPNERSIHSTLLPDNERTDVRCHLAGLV